MSQNPEVDPSENDLNVDPSEGNRNVDPSEDGGDVDPSEEGRTGLSGQGHRGGGGQRGDRPQPQAGINPVQHSE